MKWSCSLIIVILLLTFVVPLNGQQAGKNIFSRGTVKVPASLQYKDPSIAQRIFLGRNYRKAWSTPVNLPVFDLTGSGMEILELGGGQQTKSLRLLDSNNIQWVLRTVDKDIVKALPAIVRNDFTISMLQDMVSAAHPYAPLIIPSLARATGVIVANPVFYYVPDDPAFGVFRSVFAGQVCMLERREVMPGNPQTLSTDKMIDSVLAGSLQVEKESYLKARLLDMLIADWDRHEDQWLWAKGEARGMKVVVALPKDRDQALFFSQGILIKLAAFFGVRHFVGFENNSEHLIGLNEKSYEMDKFILAGLSENIWRETAAFFTNALTDEVIRESVRQMPPEIYKINGEKIVNKLIGRRNTFRQGVMRYYAFLFKEVVLTGNDLDEHFSIHAQGDSLVIVIHNLLNKTSQQKVIYPRVTRTLRILGLGGNDTFQVTGSVPVNLKLYLDGGTGENVFNNLEKPIKGYHSDNDAGKYRKTLFKKLKID